MKIFRTLFFGIALLFLGSCKEDTSSRAEPAPEAVTTFYLIRHAEKDRSNPENIDPELTQRGLGRAMHWAEILREVPLDAIYTTDYQRTEMTAAPTAVKQDLSPEYYDPESLDIEQFKMTSLGKNVLVVGHSNTTPELANALLGEERYAAMEDSDNGSLFIVQRVGNQATAMRLHFSCNCPD